MRNFDSNLYNIGNLADKRFEEILDKAKTRVANHFRIPKYLFNAKFEISHLPEIYGFVSERFGNYVIGSFRKVGKTLGEFIPYANKAFIDPINLSNFRRLYETIVHELVHEAQLINGKIGKLPRYALEAEASAVSKILTGNLQTYF